MVLIVATALSAALSQAQHLRWLPKPIPVNYTCIYGEIEVLYTGPGIYFCGCNWWPAAEAGGYTGIQDLGNRHVMIFSIWDTNSELKSQAVDWAYGTEAGRFGGEGVGARTIRKYDWQVRKTYRYFVVKRQSPKEDVTLTSAFYYDDDQKQWVYSATIASPNLAGHGGIGGFGGGLNAFLENFGGQEKDQPKLALYRLWMGTSPQSLSEVTQATGDGTWGILNNSFFLAQGHDDATRPIINGAQIGDVQPTFGKSEWLTVGERKLPLDLVKQLEQLAKR